MDAKIIEISTETEALVLGALLNSPENAKIGLRIVHEDDFFDSKHKIILKTLRDVFNEKSLVDIELIKNKLSFEENIKEVGGYAYLLELTQMAGTSLHIEAYCEDLKKLTVKRQLLAFHNLLATDLKQGADVSKIIEKCKEQIKSIEKYNKNDGSAYKYLLENNSEQKLIEELKKISPGVSTGFTIGEEKIIIPGGALSVIAMPTSHGKTATLINFSIGVLNHHSDKSVYFFTYEESGASIQTLFINTWINKEISKNNRNSIKDYFRKGDMNYMNQTGRETFESDKQAFFTNFMDTGRLKVFYSDMSAEELIAAIFFIKKNTNVGLVCIDYIQFLKLLNPSLGSRQDELKQICLMLKDCAVETGLPILLGAQFNRQVIAEADLSPINIREAGDIEQATNLLIGGWNRNFAGFSRKGNEDKSGKSVPKEPSIYFEVMKGREIGNGHNSVMNFCGNTGKLENRSNNSSKHPLSF